jgi:hypothetical protein
MKNVGCRLQSSSCPRTAWIKNVGSRLQSSSCRRTAWMKNVGCRLQSSSCPRTTWMKNVECRLHCSSCPWIWQARIKNADVEYPVGFVHEERWDSGGHLPEPVCTRAWFAFSFPRTDYTGCHAKGCHMFMYCFRELLFIQKYLGKGEVSNAFLGTVSRCGTKTCLGTPVLQIYCRTRPSSGSNMR